MSRPGDIYGPNIIGSVDHTFLDQLRRWQPRLILMMESSFDDVNAVRAVCPSAYIIYRIYRPDGEYRDRILADPEAAAEWAHGLVMDRIRRDPELSWLVDCWQTNNEVCQKWDELPKLARFELRKMQFAVADGIIVGIGATSVGNLHMPEDDRMAYYLVLKDALLFAVAHGMVWICHLYGWPDLFGPERKGGAAWLINRLELQLLPNLPPELRDLLIAVTEYCVDRLLNDEPAGGWTVSPVYGQDLPLLIEDLDNMAEWLASRPQADQVIGYCLYCFFNNGDVDWESYRFDGVPTERLIASAKRRRLTAPPPAPPVEPPPPQEEPMEDPRDSNCRALHTDANGKVDGVKLTYLPLPGKFVLKRVRLIDEIAAAGQTVATILVYDQHGMPMLGPKVYLAWEWDGVGTTFENRLLPGNTNYPPNHVIVNGYDATITQGPLAIYVGEADGSINSDVIAGLGLPWNRHVGYELLFQERIAVTPPVEPPPPPPTTPGEPPPPVLVDITALARNKAWNSLYPTGGIPYNPTAAYQRVARTRKLGSPNTLELDVYADIDNVPTLVARGQGFALGILISPPGVYTDAAIQTVEW